MAISNNQRLGSFSVGRKTASADTAFTILVPPYGAVGNAAYPGGAPGKQRPLTGVPHITSLILDSGSTAHTLTLLRPLNYTWAAAAAAASQAVIVLYDDPGAYSTNYRYPLANGVSGPSTSNNLIAASDYCVYQAADGHWVVDTVSSVSSLSITMTANLPGGGVVAGALFYFFGITTDTDPATNLAHQQFGTTTSARLSYTDPNGLFCAYHAGDPLILYDPNTTAADTLQLLSGFHEQR